LTETAAELEEGVGDVFAFYFGRTKLKVNTVFKAALDHTIFDGLRWLLFAEVGISYKNS